MTTTLDETWQTSTTPSPSPADPPDPDAVPWSENTFTHEGLKWIVGRGYTPADYMIVGEKPDGKALDTNEIFKGDQGALMFKVASQAGFDMKARVYFTNAIKYLPPGNKAINTGDIKKCRPFLQQEIARVKPKVIICLGANALKTVLGTKAALQSYRGTFTTDPALPDTRIFAMYSPGAVIRSPHLEADFLRDWELVARDQHGTSLTVDKVDYTVISKAADLAAIKEMLDAEPDEKLIVLDAEWHGENWMDPKRYIRTVQLGIETGFAVVVEFTGVGGVQVMDDMVAGWAGLKAILEHPKVRIAGHNVIADGQWLMSYGIDIRNQVVYDTMLAEHIGVNELGPFDLTSLTLKYTRLGKYDIEIDAWIAANKKLVADGYGYVPRELLIPYGAYDVDAPRRIMQAQLPLLGEFMQPRGPNNEFPSLLETIMNTQRILYEIEGTGMLIDRERMDEITKAYMAKLSELETRLDKMAKTLVPEAPGYTVSLENGQPIVVMDEADPNFLQNFNYRSTAHVQKLLFEVLKLTPIKTTSGKAWGRHMINQNTATQKLYNPATDKNTLDILKKAHPIIGLLSDTKKLNTTCTTFLNEDQTKGIAAQIWPDGRIHSRFSMLSDTGRFRTSSPNCQNWPKKAEGYMADIFGGKDKVPPLVRTVVVPSPGCLMVEADFVQAELFVLAALSGDQKMLGVLTTPGKDMHDMTAISGFGLKVLDPDGREVDEQFLLDMAARDIKEFEAYQKKLIYLDQLGHKMDRATFKNTIRVSAKNVNFGCAIRRVLILYNQFE